MKKTFRYVVGNLPKDVDYENATKKQLKDIETIFDVRIVDVQFSTDTYKMNGSLAVMLMTRPDKDDCEYFGLSKEKAKRFTSPFCTVTVNTEESSLLPKNTQFVNENDNPGISKWLVRNKIATRTNRIHDNGFCKFRAYRFNTDKM